MLAIGWVATIADLWTTITYYVYCSKGTWLVRLQYRGSSPLCYGALLSPTAVLTTEECMRRLLLAEAERPGRPILAALSGGELKTLSAPPATPLPPSFVQLLSLVEPIDFSVSRVRPICLLPPPPPPQPREGTFLRSLGAERRCESSRPGTVCVFPGWLDECDHRGTSGFPLAQGSDPYYYASREGSRYYLRGLSLEPPRGGCSSGRRGTWRFLDLASPEASAAIARAVAAAERPRRPRQHDQAEQEGEEARGDSEEEEEEEEKEEEEKTELDSQEDKSEGGGGIRFPNYEDSTSTSPATRAATSTATATTTTTTTSTTSIQAFGKDETRIDPIGNGFCNQGRIS